MPSYIWLTFYTVGKSCNGFRLIKSKSQTFQTCAYLGEKKNGSKRYSSDFHFKGREEEINFKN